MTKIMLIYPPFCTPATPPYSVAALYSFLKLNIGNSVKAIDLNLEFHKMKFAQYGKYFHGLKEGYDAQEYETITKKFREESKKTYTENNNSIIKGNKPELYDEMLERIMHEKPDIAAFSIVYSSQAAYAHALIKELKEKGIKVVVGGPAVSEKLAEEAVFLSNETELLRHACGDVMGGKRGHVPDFSIFSLKEYFTPEPVIPIRTSRGCYHSRCTFCTHHDNAPYHENNLETIRKTIIESGQKKFFIIDDMIHKKRLIELAKVIKPLNVKWTCQLRPTKDLDYETLRTLRESGLVMIIWGVESGSDRILSLMEKGTKADDIEKVLEDSHNAGIANVTYIMFGFPTETKEDFLSTIEFLKRNEASIDQISTSVFSLQQGTKIYSEPERYGITGISESKRTVLDPEIRYTITKGLSGQEAKKLRMRYKKTLDKIRKFPKEMNFFREHMLCLIK